MSNLLIGAISGNYTVGDIKTWVISSKFEGVERLLLLYNRTSSELENYLKEQGITVVIPAFDFWGQSLDRFNVDTGTVDISTSYNLVHNIRFFHIWSFLCENKYEKVLITDVKDVCFNRNPFDNLSEEVLTATSEEVLYKEEAWNQNHLHTNIGIIGLEVLLDKPVYNVGVFGGSYELVKDMCADIYLLSCGKHKVADQTSFNYLIHTKYKNKTNYTSLKDNFAVHLHVINAGLVPFDLHAINNYSIIHQYDRLGNEIQHYYTVPK
jgi:hypothetical protein